MQRPLSEWTLAEIYDIYATYGELLGQYKGIKERCQIPKSMHIKFDDESNVFISRFNREIVEIDKQLAILDREIERRQPKA